MKIKNIILIFIFSPFFVFSQDIVIMNTGDTLKNLKITSIDDHFFYIQQNLNGHNWNSLIKKEKITNYIISKKAISVNSNNEQSQTNNNFEKSDNLSVKRKKVSIEFGYGYSFILKKYEDLNEETLNKRINELRITPNYNFALTYYITQNFGIGGRVNYSKKISNEFNDILIYSDEYNNKKYWSGKFKRNITNVSILSTRRIKLDNKYKQSLNIIIMFGKNFLTQGGEYNYTEIYYNDKSISYNETFNAVNNKKWSLGGSVSYEYNIFKNMYIGAETNYQHYKVKELKSTDEYKETENKLDFSRVGLLTYIKFR